ncbi:MAG: putative toxin-antitoxin system toxin component, PIN family [Pedosphaera sp.]|nr:putative toxin-antitoxin system toxin component, PIN family [Pedosphaera sp.]
MPSGRNGGDVKAVVDTNLPVSGLLWPGNPYRLLDAILDNRVELCSTEALLAELSAVLRRPRLAIQVAKRGLDADWSWSFIRERCSILTPVGTIEFPALRDRKDLPVLAAAAIAAPDFIITGDKDLLVLNEFAGIPIVTVVEALKRLGLA